MKIRNGFVSNSSSSSFIVFFPYEPEGFDDVKQMLFEDDEKYYNPFNYDENSPKCWDVNEIVDIVLNDIKSQDKNDFDKIEEIFRPDIKILDDLLDDYFKDKISWDNYSIKYNKIKEENLKYEMSKIKNKDNVYIFEYSDESFLGAAMEHGDLFKRIPHIRNNNH